MMLKSCGVVGGWVVVWCTLDYSSGPFLSYEIEIGDGPGPEIDNLGQILSKIFITTPRLLSNNRKSFFIFCSFSGEKCKLFHCQTIHCS